ncbi:MAG: C25 family cysteine peptidase [Candidatus Promineifilaceae bacterium]
MPTNTIQAVTIDSHGELLLESDLTIQEDLLNEGSLQLPNKGHLTVGGNWSNSGTFIHNDGTVTFNSHDITITGDTTFCHLTLELDNNQTFALTSGTTITIAGNFSRSSSGDMLAEADATVVMTSECDGGGTKVVTGEGAKNFYNFEIADGATIDHSGKGNLNITNNFVNDGIMTLSDDMVIGGNFTNNSSFTSTDDVAFNNTSEMFGTGTTIFHRVTVQGGDTLDANTHNFSLTGNFSVSSGGVFTGDANTVTFNGSSAQKIRSSGTKNFHNVILDNPSGLSFASTSMAVASTIEGELTFIAGQFDVNGEVLQFGLDGSTSGATSNRYIVAVCSGNVRKRVNDSHRAFVFPLGDDTSGYSPAESTFAAASFTTTAYISVCVTDSKHPNNSAASNFITRYWTVDTSGVTDASAELTFVYLDADVNGDDAVYVGGQYDGNWQLDIDSVTAATNIVTFDTVNQFGDFTAGDSTLPITLARFHSQFDGSDLVIEWETATETATLGFNLYADRQNERILLNDRLIPAQGFSSVTSQAYRYKTEKNVENAIYLEEISIYGKELFGPFAIGDTVGHSLKQETINWDLIHTEHAQQLAQRQTQTAITVQQQIRKIRQGTRKFDSTRLLRFGVDEDGIYQVTHADLLAVGVDLTGLASADLALINQNKAVPIEVSGGSVWNKTSAIAFFGTALDTLYTTQNVYWLYNDFAQAKRITTDSTRAVNPPESYYMATVTLAENARYDTTNWGTDPWYMTRLIATDAPASASYNIEIDQVVEAAAPISVTLTLFADTSFDVSPDHHVLLNSAETTLIDATFDGLRSHQLSTTIPTIQNGNNTFTVTLPHDLGMPHDVIGVEALQITYPRAFVAIDDQLDFVSGGNTFQVTGFSEAPAKVYRVEAGEVTTLQMTNAVVNAATYHTTFAGAKHSSRYVVAAESQFKRPNIQPARQITADENVSSVDYVMIAHADFMDALDPLVAHHTANGLVVQVVDVADVFDQFSAGIFDPQAIKSYIADAVTQKGVHYVLLVGNDTYDYHDYLGVGSISFIPSFYRSNGDVVRWGPSDPHYADIDDDGRIDVALGRFPARTSAEVTHMISKTLSYMEPNTYAERVIFASDKGFSASSNVINTQLPINWRSLSTDLDEMTLDESRQLLLKELNRGVAFVNFFGHSGPTRWTQEGLFHSADAAKLTNAHRPTLFLQYGCWNTYYVDPTYRSLAHQLMGNGLNGAAAVLGGTTLTSPLTDQLIGEAMLTYLTKQHMTIGDALQHAKQDVAQSHPQLIDAQIGYTILGDPALTLPSFALTSPVMLHQVTVQAFDPSALFLLVAVFLLTSCTFIVIRRAQA